MKSCFESTFYGLGKHSRMESTSFENKDSKRVYKDQWECSTWNGFDTVPLNTDSNVVDSINVIDHIDVVDPINVIDSINVLNHTKDTIESPTPTIKWNPLNDTNTFLTNTHSSFPLPNQSFMINSKIMNQVSNRNSVQGNVVSFNDTSRFECMLDLVSPIKNTSRGYQPTKKIPSIKDTSLVRKHIQPIKTKQSMDKSTLFESILTPTSPIKDTSIVQQCIQPIKTILTPTSPSKTTKSFHHPTSSPIPTPISPTKTTTSLCRQTTSPKAPTHILSDDGTLVWELISSIGKGGCGEVFLGKQLDKQDFVAIKIIKDRKQFCNEYNTMKLLQNQGPGSTPTLYHVVKKRKMIIMEYLSETIAQKFEQCSFRFSCKTIIMLTLNMMSLVRDFHEKTKQIHVDIKPSNICTSSNGKELYLIDFGYSTFPFQKLPGQTGTPLFMSETLQTIGATYPCIQDDFESIGYVLLFFIAGGKRGLPWGQLRTHKEIAATKTNQTIIDFCTLWMGTEYEPLLIPLQHYFQIVRDRTRTFTWNHYDMLYQHFEHVLFHCGWTNDHCYDWCIENKYKNDPDCEKSQVKYNE